MKNHKILFISTFLFGLLIQGCGTEKQLKTSSPKAIGESASITTNDSNAKMAPSKHALKSVSNQIGKILKLHIDELNAQEAVSFDKETHYCDISGVKNTEHHGDLQKIIMNKHYRTCKNTNHIQNGKIQITYKELDENGQFPKSLDMTSTHEYKFNNLTLNKEIYIESKKITYNNSGLVKSISLKITGTVYNYTQKLQFKNYKHQFLF